VSRADGLFWLVLVAGAVADQVSKYVTLCFLPASGIQIFPWFWLTPVRNRGVSFGLFSSGVLTVPVIIASVAVLAVLIFHAGWSAARPAAYRVAMGMIAGGILGNLADRVVRGSVVDFLDFRVWPVFNIADSLIVIGVCIVLFLHLRARCASGMHPNR